MNKKGFELQFHWIFILIAGAIILAFFFAIVSKQKDISEQRISITLSNDIEAIASGAGVTRGSVQPIPLPRITIEFSCTDLCDCSYSPGAGVSKSFKDNLIFAPGKITGNQMILWTLDWKAPFRVANFVYITNDRVKYFFVSDANNALKRVIEKKLPPEVNAEFVNENFGIKNEDYFKTKIIYLNTRPPLSLLNSFKKADASALFIDSDNSVSFYSKPFKSQNLNFEGKTYYINDESLLAAIFSEDFNMYECNMEQAFKRVSYVANVSSQRALELHNSLSSSRPECSYLRQKEELTKLSRNAKNQATGVNEVDTRAIAGSQDDLNELNNILLQQSCPTIY